MSRNMLYYLTRVLHNELPKCGNNKLWWLRKHNYIARRSRYSSWYVTSKGLKLLTQRV